MQAYALMQLNVFPLAHYVVLQANMLYFTHAAHSVQIGMLTCCPDHAGTCTNAT